MGTIEPWRTPFGSAQHAQANHPPPGHGKSIIKGLFSATVPIRLVLNQTHVDPSPVPHGFARLGLALFSTVFPTNTWHLKGVSFTFPTNVSIEPNGLLLVTA